MSDQVIFCQVSNLPDFFFELFYLFGLFGLFGIFSQINLRELLKHLFNPIFLAGLLEQGKILFVKPIFAVTAEINIGKNPPVIGKHKFRNKGMGFNYFDFDFAAGISFNLGKGDAGKFRQDVSSGQVQRTNVPRIGSPEITPDTRALILLPEKINRCRCGDKHNF